MNGSQLAPEQEAEAERVAAVVGRKARQGAVGLARLLASERDAGCLTVLPRTRTASPNSSRDPARP
jgi:hypothetical protein